MTLDMAFGAKQYAAQPRRASKLGSEPHTAARLQMAGGVVQPRWSKETA